MVNHEEFMDFLKDKRSMVIYDIYTYLLAGCVPFKIVKNIATPEHFHAHRDLLIDCACSLAS